MSNLLNSNDIELMQKYSDENGLTEHGFMRNSPHARVLYFSMASKRTELEDQLLLIARKELAALECESVKLFEEFIAGSSGVQP